jgi:sRNA-binding protein
MGGVNPAKSKISAITMEMFIFTGKTAMEESERELTPAQRALQVLGLLRKELPKCFKKTENKQPLKNEIDLDLIKYYKNDDRFTQEELNLALYFYTHGKQYLELIIEGAKRIDLKGKAVSKVTAAEAEYAQELLKRRLKKAEKEKRESEDEPDEVEDEFIE